MPDTGALLSPVADLIHRIQSVPRLPVCGRVRRVVGLVAEATGLEGASMGETCQITASDGQRSLLADVIGVTESGALLMPYGEMDGVGQGSPVRRLGRTGEIHVGDHLLGRVLNALGEPIDGLGPLGITTRRPINARPPNPMERARIRMPLETGVRAIDGLLTIGRGQRMGIFAGSGVGKSVLLGMIARHTQADVNVICLLGERGREVLEFVEDSLGPEGLSRSVVICATGDEPALLRARCGLVATAIAEHFRDQGKDVLLMVDSVTRIAMAWREIGIAAGEPPTTKGYTPSVFAQLPRLLERAGTSRIGSITGLYTVLVDGDDFNEPIADAARSILDGHIVLSRKLGDAGHFPAIEFLESRSRVRDDVIDPEHLRAANALARYSSAYREAEDFILMGEYQQGSNREVDAMLAHRDDVLSYLRQRPEESTPFEQTRAWLLMLEARLKAHVAAGGNAR